MKTRQRRRSAWMLAGAGATAAALLSACNLDASGAQPPPGKLAYPIAVALSHEATPRTLYVANSNFDLSYGSGSVQAYELGQLDQKFEQCRNVKQRERSDASIELPDFTRLLDAGRDIDAAINEAGVDLLDANLADAGAGEPAVEDAGLDASDGLGPVVVPADYGAPPKGSNLAGALCDGRDHDGFNDCCLTAGDPELDSARVSEVSIDSFATGLAVSPDDRRLYVPISSRSRLVYLDIDQGRLSCGTETGRCTRGPGRGRADEDPDESFPGQPSAMATGTLADLGVAEALGKPARTPFIATAHELGGLSFFTESGPLLDTGVAAESQPLLESVRTTQLTRPTSVTVDPHSNLLYLTVSNASRANSAFIRRFGVQVDGDAVPGESGPRELLYETSSIQVAGVAQPGDLRSVALDPHDPTRLFVLARGAQQSVIFLRLDVSTGREARVTDVVRVGAGASKLAYIELDGRAFLLVSCYDARSIFVIEVATAELVSVVRSLSGPFDMTFDAARRLLYVADFRTSVLRVVDLAGLVDKSKPHPGIIATIGALRFEGRLK